MDGRHDSATQARRAGLCSDGVLAARVAGGRQCDGGMQAVVWERKGGWGKSGRLNGWDCWLAVVREAAAQWNRTSTFQGEEPEKSRVNGGNLSELSDRRTDRKEKIKKDKKWHHLFCTAGNELSSPTLLNKAEWADLMLLAGGSLLKQSEKYLRHWNDHEIQPVPWISKEGEIIYTESSCGDFNKWLKSINSCECVPARTKQWQNQLTRLDQSALISAAVLADDTNQVEKEYIKNPAGGQGSFEVGQ